MIAFRLKRRPFFERLRRHYREYRRIGMDGLAALRAALRVAI